MSRAWALMGCGGGGGEPLALPPTGGHSSQETGREDGGGDGNPGRTSSVFSPLGGQRREGRACLPRGSRGRPHRRFQCGGPLAVGRLKFWGRERSGREPRAPGAETQGDDIQ